MLGAIEPSSQVIIKGDPVYFFLEFLNLVEKLFCLGNDRGPKISIFSSVYQSVEKAVVVIRYPLSVANLQLPQKGTIKVSTLPVLFIKLSVYRPQQEIFSTKLSCILQLMGQRKIKAIVLKNCSTQVRSRTLAILNSCGPRFILPLCEADCI